MAFLIGINSGRADYDMYLEIYNASVFIEDTQFYEFVTSQHTQLGYNIFQAFVKTIFNSATLFFAVFALVGLLIRYKFYKSFTPLTDIGIVIFAFLVHEFLRKDCVQIRNGFASAVALFATIYAYKGQRTKALLIIGVGTLFHTAALVGIPVVLMRTNTSERYEKLLISILLLVFTVSYLGIFDSLIAKILSRSSEADLYLNSGVYSNIKMPMTNPMLLKQIALSIWLLYNRKRYFKDTKIFFLSQVYFLSTAYYMFFRGIQIFAVRFGSLLYAVEAPLLLMLIYKSETNIQTKKLVLCLYYFALLYYNMSAMQPFLGWNVHIY